MTSSPIELSEALVAAKAAATGGYLTENERELWGRARVDPSVAALFVAAAERPSSYGMSAVQLREDEESDWLTAEDLRSRIEAGARDLDLRLTKRSWDGVVRFLLVEEFVRAIDELELASVLTIQVAARFPPFDSLRARIEPWDSFDSPTPFLFTPTEAAPVSQTVRYSDARDIPRDISLLLVPEGETNHLEPGTLSDAWRRLAFERLAVSLASEVWRRDGRRICVARGAIVREGEIRAGDPPGAETVDLLIQAARWVYVPPTQATVRHSLLSAELARLAADNVDWNEIIRQALRPALETSRTAYQMHVQSLSAESLRALAELRKALVEDSVRIQKSISDLTTSLWRDFLVAAGALVAHFVALADARQGDRRILLWAALIFVVISGAISLASHQRAITVAANQFDAWRQRVYSFVTAQDYDALATRPMSEMRALYVVVARVTGAVYVAILVGLLYFLWPDVASILAWVPLRTE